MTESYQGYTNWATWNARLWIDELIEENIDYMQEHLQEEVESLSGLAQDLLTRSIQEINWQELYELAAEDAR